MNKYLTVISAFLTMLCLGGVYAWSIIAAGLKEELNFSSTQTQLIFGTLIAIFPSTMLIVPRISQKLSIRYLLYLAAGLYLVAYLAASLSDGSFYVILLSIGVLSGIATGIGYWVSLTVPVQWFPNRKGLITGIAAAGFGLGAILLSNIAHGVIQQYGILKLFLVIGVVYSFIIFLSSHGISSPDGYLRNMNSNIDYTFLRDKIFYKLFAGIFLGTFAGLLIIGSLKMIGQESAISNNYLVLGVSVFAFFNFLGRLFWGFLSDIIGASISIFMALLLQASAILALNFFTLSPISYTLLASLIGFGFGGNFVLFAKETAQLYGVNRLGNVYPYVFLGYALAGIFGPLTGGVLFDIFQNYHFAILIAATASLLGAIIF
ncbi:MAG: MFS transporter, partial [Bacteroidales bacterium]|nr:MFS transporter [Bacteroidales bacterium]